MGGNSGKPKFDPKNHKYQYDMIVIGGGSGGMSCAREAAKLGAKVAICDYVTPTPTGTKWGLGGTCVNVGCIPKRLMHQSNLIKDFIGDAPLFGWNVKDVPTVEWATLVDNVQSVIRSLNFTYRVQLATEKVSLFQGLASFKDSHTISITNLDAKENHMEITGQCIVIAVGGRPQYLNIPGGTKEDKMCITSDDLFSLPYPPGNTLCVGAGYISTECAGFLAGFGYEVTLMARSRVLRVFDQEMADHITSNLIGRSVSILAEVEPKEIKMVKEGTPPTLKVSYQFNGTSPLVEMECNTVLLALGRKPDTDSLNLKVVPSVKVDEAGYIITDQYECTGESHIYAIGDCAQGRPQLTPPAIKAGLFLARRVYLKKFSKVVNYALVPTTIFTPIEYGCWGCSEDEAKSRFGKDKVVVYVKRKGPLEFTFNKRDSEATNVKLVCVREKRGREKVVGFHCLGPNAGEITVGFSLALSKNCSKDEFDDLIGIHPTSAEIFGELRVKKGVGGPLQTPGC